MKNQIELMVMLTWNDKTVNNALEIFDECKDLPVQAWGFKNAGISEYDTVQVIKAMKEAGKTTYYEIINRTPEAYEYGATTAQRAKFDVMMGTKYDATLHESLKKDKIDFWPAIGQPGCFYQGQHGVLLGEEHEILDEAKKLVTEIGCDGITIPAFRYYKDGSALLKNLVKTIPGTPICVAGSVDSFDRMEMLYDLGVAQFTMGSALFNKKYVPGGTFRDNLEVVADFLVKKNMA